MQSIGVFTPTADRSHIVTPRFVAHPWKMMCRSAIEHEQIWVESADVSGKCMHVRILLHAVLEVHCHDERS